MTFFKTETVSAVFSDTCLIVLAIMVMHLVRPDKKLFTDFKTETIAVAFIDTPWIVCATTAILLVSPSEKLVAVLTHVPSTEFKSVPKNWLRTEV